METAEPALFRRFPALRRALPRWPCVASPTPVQRLALEGGRVGGLWVKRDDLSCPLYGGNKPRKLEFLIGAALARRTRRLVTTGGLGTHHGLATTILGREAGLATSVVLMRQPVTEEVQQTLLLHAAWGARLVYGGNVPGVALRAAAELARAALRGERPLLVPTGGSSIVGNVGFVDAALELADQVRSGACPEPARIFVPVGTGGTLAGLVAGLRVAGLRSRVVGVLVTDILPPSPRRLAGVARRVLERLHRLHPGFPLLSVGPDDFELSRVQLGAGYGAATPAARNAVRLGADAGLRLETTYTGKCLAELLRRRAEGGLTKQGPVLFWNTYNAVDVAARAPRPLEPGSLPPRLRRFLGPGALD